MLFSDWGYGWVSKMLALQERGSELDPKNRCTKPCALVCMCHPRDGETGGSGGEIPGSSLIRQPNLLGRDPG